MKFFGTARIEFGSSLAVLTCSDVRLASRCRGWRLVWGFDDCHGVFFIRRFDMVQALAQSCRQRRMRLVVLENAVVLFAIVCDDTIHADVVQAGRVA